MKILFLAPQPFFQERGTPMAVRLALEVLASRGRDEIHLLTYHEGVDVEIPGVRVFRIWAPAWLYKIRPGISFKKLLCDIIFTFYAFRMVWRERNDQYTMLHAVEESVFIACVIKLLLGIPYIYDMDSSLALQVTEKWSILRPFRPLFRFIEGIAFRMSTAVVPVCDALAAIANEHGSPIIHVLNDISLLDEKRSPEQIDLRREASIAPDSCVLLYIGNLERYQGIDLLVESFARCAEKDASSHLVIIGGADEHIEAYKNKAESLGLTSRIHLLGSRPVALLNEYLLQADILVSPRTLGNNTPMKVYSYLHSGRAVLATRLLTHTQVMNDDISMLAEPEPAAFSEGMLRLIREPELRREIGDRARALAEEKYTFEEFERKLNALYDKLDSAVAPIFPVRASG